ncbi:MAG: uroporphyrinogen-III C-methyltransferase [Woeseiaceae bacterium]
MSESGEDNKTNEEVVVAPVTKTAAAPKNKVARATLLRPVLLLSLLAVAAAGYMFVEDRRAQQLAERSVRSLELLENRVAALHRSLSGLDSGVAELAESDTGISSQIESLQSDVDKRAGLLDTLPGRLSNLEKSVASITGASTGTRDMWLLGEAEYYMQIANAQLQLAGNPHLAALALGMADDRIAQMANPALTAVRRAIANELAALEIMSKPDVEGITLTLASLARVVESLPLKGDAGDAASDTGVEDAQLSGTARAWASIKGAFSGLVKVTAPDETDAILVTPNAERLIRSNLALQLQSARLALLRNEQAIFDQSLDDADAWLTLYFDTASAPVAGARETIAEMRDGVFAVTAPDISDSLRLIRQFRALPEPAQ